MVMIRGLWVLQITLAITTLVPCGSPAYAKYGGGTGEPNNPYLINTAEQLNAIGADPNDWDKHFRLMANIDLSAYEGTAFNLIGNEARPFSGVFDGNRHTIANLTYHHDSAYYVGLFGYISDPNAKVVNLGLVHVRIDAGSGNFVGSLAGSLAEGIVANCFAEGGRITGTVGVGGLVGENRGFIANSYATCAVAGSRCVGGLAGTNGLCGRGGDTPCHSGTISSCYSCGPVTAAEYVGGLVGFPTAGGVHSCFWNTETSGQATSAGGDGITTAQMQDPNTFRVAGWDFFGAADGPGEVWTTDPNTGYAILWWQVPEARWPQLSYFSGGLGTPQDPYLIATAEHLNSIGHNPRLMNACFKLTNDIDLRGIHFFSIGSEATPFAGVFDGGGRTISNFTRVCEDEYATGLFGYVRGENVQIKSLTLIDPVIDVNAGEFTGSLIGRLYQGEATDCHVEGGTVSGYWSTGGLVGHNDFGRIMNCHSTGTVTGFYYTGGLIGSDDYGWIKDCHSSAGVAGSTFAGGVIGICWNTVVTNCHATGVVKAEGTAGGLVGENSGATLTHCYSTGAVSGDDAGGLVGINGGPIIACYATGEISGDQSVGGLVGSHDGAITNCHATGAVTGNTVVGGLVGGSSGSVTSSYSTGSVYGNDWDIGGLVGSNGGYITSSYATGNVMGYSYVGGLAGYNDWRGTILNCYATGSVRGIRGVGGFTGRNGHVIKNCYAIGRVESPGISNIGGFIGWLDEGLIEASFWDVQRSDWPEGAGGIGKTTAEMQMARTFLDAGWDFVDETQNGTADVWWILEGQDYPRLNWERDNQP
jgi:hypothetical protein